MGEGYRQACSRALLTISGISGEKERTIPQASVLLWLILALTGLSLIMDRRAPEAAELRVGGRPGAMRDRPRTALSLDNSRGSRYIMSYEEGDWESS